MKQSQTAPSDWLAVILGKRATIMTSHPPPEASRTKQYKMEI